MNRVEALKNLKLLEEDKAVLLSLNHLNSTWVFKNQCEMRVKQINGYVKNIEKFLNIQNEENFDRIIQPK